MPTTTNKEVKQRLLNLNRHRQEVWQNDEHQHQHQQHLSCEHSFSSSCNKNKPAAQQEQKHSALADFKVRLSATPSPAYHPYIREEINQQLDRAISILFPHQINQYRQKQKQKNHNSVIPAEMNHSKETTQNQKTYVNVTTNMKQNEKTGTKEHFEDSVKRRRLKGKN